MALKVKVNKQTCIGCGVCAVIAEKTFKLDNQGKSVVKPKIGDNKETINEAMVSCPEGAITISGD